MALELNGTTGVSLVQDGVVATADLADGAVTAAKLNSTLDLSGKTVTLPAGVGGATTFISTTDISNAATVDITMSSGYDAYQFVLGNVIPVTNGAGLEMRTSSNSGSSFDSGASDYNWGLTYLDMDSGNAVASLSLKEHSIMRVTRDFVGGFGTGAGISGTITVYHPHLSRETHLYGGLTFTNSSGRSVRNEFGGTRRSSTAVNAVRFFMTSGNVHSGTITLYGMKNA